MTNLKIKNREWASREYLKKLQSLHKEAGRQKLTNKLKHSSAAAE